MKRKKINHTILTVAVVGSLAVVNIIGLAIFGRLDLTRDDQFTLSQATRLTLRSLKDPVTVRAYFSRELPPPYSGNARFVQDILDEYYNHADGNFRYEFIDPESQETGPNKEKKKEVKRDLFGRPVAEPTSVERELTSLGIPPVQVRVRERDKLEVKNAYMGISIKYGDKTEAIPLVSDTEGLEYSLTTLIRKLTRDKPPKVALITDLDHAALQEQYGRMVGTLNRDYVAQPTNLQGGDEIPADADTIIVLGPKTPFTPDQVAKLDAYVMSGRSAAFLLDSVKPDLQTLQTQEAKHGLEDLLKSYGVVIDKGLVLDAECAQINVTQQRGFMHIMQAVKYPFIPLPQSLDLKHPLTRGLAQVAFPFVSPLKVELPAGSKVKAEVLVKSSPHAWVQKPPYNLDPFQRWTLDVLGEPAEWGLVVTLSGPLKSTTQSSDAKAASESSESPPAGANARVLVVGGSSFVNDHFLSRTNEAFLLNLLDWLLLDDALMAVRSRGLAAAPLVELSDGERETVKYFNIAVVPIGFAAFGLARWRFREAKRARVTV